MGIAGTRRTRPRTNRLTTALCAAATLAVVLSACSSASSSSGAGASTAATGSSSAKGSPIQFVVISGTGPGTPGADQYLVPGAQAAVDEINAAGGVKGHPLQLNFCNTQGNVNQAGTCAASAVANSSVIASIGNYNYLGGTEIYPIFEKAGLPAIAVHGVGPPEYSSPVIFPTDVGAIGNDTGAVALLAHEGIHSAALIAFTPSSYQTYVQAIDTYTIPALAKAGMQFKLDPPVLFPGTATSLSSYAAQTIALKPPAVILSLGPTQAITFLQALRQQGYTGIVVCSAGVTPASQIKQVLGRLRGISRQSDTTVIIRLAGSNWRPIWPSTSPSTGLGDRRRSMAWRQDLRRRRGADQRADYPGSRARRPQQDLRLQHFRAHAAAELHDAKPASRIVARVQSDGGQP